MCKFIGKKFDLDQNMWINIASLHTKRSKMSVLECCGNIYVIGGFDGSQTLNSVECYNPTTNRCSKRFCFLPYNNNKSWNLPSTIFSQ